VLHVRALEPSELLKARMEDYDIHAGDVDFVIGLAVVLNTPVEVLDDVLVSVELQGILKEVGVGDLVAWSSASVRAPHADLLGALPVNDDESELVAFAFFDVHHVDSTHDAMVLIRVDHPFSVEGDVLGVGGVVDELEPFWT
jgi:hypothetical protein